ncbi:hypothetical protein FQN60_005252 [Etheostoma spectabile]|uniref:Uncharacterized protein n=1 Tax=Etheostoma spectabile TaxID=54343 RepID=A0A5J5C8Q2_9PERO|nr:hypothetical protein FQN60_005252 [Etheostoma spectabile]
MSCWLMWIKDTKSQNALGWLLRAHSHTLYPYPIHTDSEAFNSSGFYCHFQSHHKSLALGPLVLFTKGSL